MYRFDGFTEKANNALNLALTSAEDMGHTYIGSEHIILGLLKENSGVAAEVFKQAWCYGRGIYKMHGRENRHRKSYQPIFR